MGYDTKFSGHIALSRKLTMAEAKALLEYNNDPDCIPGDTPGSYMQWVPSETLDAIVYDGNEKFYEYVDWMKWVTEWLAERQIEANGVIFWSGESVGDTGRITVTNNDVQATADVKTSCGNYEPLSLDKLARIALEAATN